MEHPPVSWDRIPPVKAVMTPFPHTVPPDASVSEAAGLMERFRIRHLPVKDGDELVGIVSQRDVRECLARTDGGPLRVEEISVRQVCTFGLDTPLDLVLEAMWRRRIGSTLVVKDGRLAGIVTASDACRLFAQFLRKMLPGDGEVA